MAPFHISIYLFISRLEKKEGELQGERDRGRSLEVQVCAITHFKFYLFLLLAMTSALRYYLSVLDTVDLL